jgi:hypothetical protein
VSGEGIHEEVLRAPDNPRKRKSISRMPRYAIRAGVPRAGRPTRRARMSGGQDRRWPRLGHVDSPGRERRTQGAGALAA